MTRGLFGKSALFPGEYNFSIDKERKTEIKNPLLQVHVYPAFVPHSRSEAPN